MSFLDQSHDEVKQKQSNPGLLLTKIAQCQGHLFKVGAELIMQTILNVGEGRVQFFQVGRAFSPI